MMTSVLTQEQINKSVELLNRIRTDEGELFPEYVNGEDEKYSYLEKGSIVRFFDDGENCGVFASIIFWGIYRIFIAFEKDTDKYTRELTELILLANEKNNGVHSEISFIAEQAKLIESMRKTLNFNPGYYASHEFIMDKENFKGFSNGKQLEIRPFEADRIDEYALLLDNAMTFVSPPANFQGDKAGLAERIKGNAFSAFYKDGGLAGLYWLDNDFYTIDIMAVAPAHQRQGYGSIILSHAIENVFTVQNKPLAKLYCVDWNEKGLAFYKKFGMIHKGHTYSMNLAE